MNRLPQFFFTIACQSVVFARGPLVSKRGSLGLPTGLDQSLPLKTSKNRIDSATRKIGYFHYVEPIAVSGTDGLEH